jgi:S1-C subfamily serine protease
LGYSLGGPLQSEAGSVVQRGEFRVSDIWLDSFSGRELLATTLDVAEGDSGGPVLNSSGQVVGIIFAGSSGRRGPTSFADDLTELRQLIDQRPNDSGTSRCADGRVDIR